LFDELTNFSFSRVPEQPAFRGAGFPRISLDFEMLSDFSRSMPVVEPEFFRRRCTLWILFHEHVGGRPLFKQNNPPRAPRKRHRLRT